MRREILENLKNYINKENIIMKKFIENTVNKAVNRTAGAALALRRHADEFMKKEDGETNLVAILLIIVVTVALVAVFKDKMTGLVETIFKKIEVIVSKI